ncbi:MAG: Rrf2 family transcriptional regulator [Myxococcota bacterium]
MQLLAQEEYGLRCLIQVARQRGPDPLTIPEIAEREGISPEYAAKLMRALRQSDFVASTRGAGGGYRLARPASEITAWQVIQALGGSLFPAEFCDTHPGQLRDCVHSSGCSLRDLWSTVESAIRNVLQGVTLADLARDERMLLAIDAPPLEPKVQVPR